MKLVHILCFAIMIFSVLSLADERIPIDSFCSIRLGTYIAQPGRDMLYFFTPKEKIRAFDKYSMMLTPIGRKVFAVCVSQEFKEKSGAENEMTENVSIFSKYYGIKPSFERRKDGDFFTFEFSNAALIVSCQSIEDRFMTNIMLIDNELSKKAQAESRQIETGK